MDNFFADFLSPDSIFIMIVALGGFLIGFIVAWLLWSSRAKRYQQEAEQWKKNHADLLTQYNDLKEDLELKEADLVKAQRESKEAIEIAKSLEADKDKWQADLDAAIEDNVKAQASISSYQATISDLDNQVIGLKVVNDELTAIASGSSSSDNENDNAALEARINELETSNNQLQAELELAQAFKAGSSPDNVSDKEDQDIFAPAPEKTTIDKGESVTLTAVAAKDKVSAAIGKSIPAATMADKDDLTKIKGIGSFLEKKLNGLGIFTYEQISHFDDKMINDVTAAIEFFPGRIERDDWVGQAKQLMAAAAEAPVVAAANAIKMDNLRIVEGIGPKIEKLLKDNDVPDLNTLADASEKRLREILFSAGSRYRIHDPTTWPKQASLAVNGEMEQLQELQDKLKGGRDVG